MVTMVGTQSNLNELLENLIELDFDAVEAYQAAIERLENATYRTKLTEFMEDHIRHTQVLSRVLEANGGNPPRGPDAKSFLTEGKVVLAGLIGEKAILRAMKSNEVDTNTAYERAYAHRDASANLRGTFQDCLADERRHRAWIDAQLERM